MDVYGSIEKRLSGTLPRRKKEKLHDKTHKAATLEVLGSAKRLGEKVGRVLSASYMREGDGASFDFVAQMVGTNVDMLGPGLVNGVY